MRKEELLSEPRMLGLSGEENLHEFVGPLCKLLEDFNIDLRSTVVEIGCFGGVSTELFALSCKHVYAIDPWGLQYTQSDPEQNPNLGPDEEDSAFRRTHDRGAPWLKDPGGETNNGLTWKENILMAEKVFDERMKQYDNVTKIKSFSTEAVEQIEDRSVDLVYIDGRHNFAGIRSDILNYFPKLKVGGVLAGHDYAIPSVRRCVLHLSHNYFSFKKYEDGSWAIPKNEEVELDIPINLKL